MERYMWFFLLLSESCNMCCTAVAVSCRVYWAMTVRQDRILRRHRRKSVQVQNETRVPRLTSIAYSDIELSPWFTMHMHQCDNKLKGDVKRCAWNLFPTINLQTKSNKIYLALMPAWRFYLSAISYRDY